MTDTHTSRYELDLILAIARRAADAFPNIDRPITFWALDVENAHTKNGPLRLHELLAADKSTFAHDMLGIYAHMDRKTGKLTDCFVPRLAMQQAAA